MSTTCVAPGWLTATFTDSDLPPMSAKMAVGETGPAVKASAPDEQSADVMAGGPNKPYLSCLLQMGKLSS